MLDNRIRDKSFAHYGNDYVIHLGTYCIIRSDTSSCRDSGGSWIIDIGMSLTLLKSATVDFIDHRLIS